MPMVKLVSELDALSPNDCNGTELLLVDKDGMSHTATLAGIIGYFESHGSLGDMLGDEAATAGTLAKRDALGNLSARSFLSTSDARYKKDITGIPDPLHLIESLRGVRFRWRDTDQLDYGFTAQNVQEVLPDLVTSDADGFLRIKESGIVAVLVEAVKTVTRDLALCRSLLIRLNANLPRYDS
jgi:hypothetical protein